MKINRYKKVHRTLSFYSLHFGFRKPYQVLIDGTLCLAALKNKINLKEQLTKYLDGEVKLLTTQCIIKETEALGPAVFGATFILKQYPIHQCGHVKTSVPGSACILSMISGHDESRYIVASQDRELQGTCRRMPGVPILYLHTTSPTLETPSPTSLSYAEGKTREQCSLQPREQRILDSLNEPKQEPERRKRKRPAGPNPLSCKRKKAKSASPSVSKPKQKARKRKRSILAKKVRKEILTGKGN